jgi:hypothetical protein
MGCPSEISKLSAKEQLAVDRELRRDDVSLEAIGKKLRQ